ncbi:MAG: glycosyltransferase [Candidatus Goldbacteria bacterium]|nr:glycosyltransferase [Candidatus Goldiibacteriota bacterium]
MPKVTVILSAFNAEKYIKEAIESILAQSFSDFEFFIVNDGSVDKTGSIIASFKDKRIIKINNKKNKGVGVSVNKCFNAAKGMYIARMDADDISMPQRFEKQVKFLDENMDVGICGCWIKTFGSGKHYINKYPSLHQDIKFKMLTENPFPQPGIMLRKKMFDRHNLRYKPECFPSEDYELWERAIRFIKGANIPEVLLKYRVHPQNASNKGQKKQIKVADDIRIRQLRKLLGKTNHETEEIFIRLVNKEGTGGRRFIDKSFEILFALKNSALLKQEYTAVQMDPLIESCWSFACKTELSFYSINNYAAGLKKMGINAGYLMKIRQILRSIKFSIIKKIKLILY